MNEELFEFATAANYTAGIATAVLFDLFGWDLRAGLFAALALVVYRGCQAWKAEA
jgi:hypothetical protein